MKQFPYLSLHPKLAVAIEVVFGFVWLTFLPQIDVWWKFGVWIGIRLFWWMLLIRVIFFSAALSRIKHWVSLGFFLVGCSAYIVFIDQARVGQGVEAAAVLLPAISFLLLPSTDQELSFALKPERRWRFFMVVLGLSGIWSGIIGGKAFGVYLFNIGWLVIAGSIATLAISAWWWREYGLPVGKRFWQSSVAIFLLTLETAWAVTVSPLGFFEGALVITWLWYVLWLLFRFHLSAEGVVWRKQWFFLVFNALGMIVFLTLVVRWK